MITNKNIELLESSFHKLSTDKKNHKQVKNSFEKIINNSIDNIKNIAAEDESIIDRMLSLYSL
jgi:flagellar hook-basal body complex protein FliE